MADLNKTGSLDPFQGNSQQFSWDREVQLSQLQAEVDAASGLGPEVRLAMIFPKEEDGQLARPTKTAPITVYVTPSGADLDAVRSVLRAHRPNPYYGMSDEQRQDAQLREKIAAKQELTPGEMQRAFQLLLG